MDDELRVQLKIERLLKGLPEHQQERVLRNVAERLNDLRAAARASQTTSDTVEPSSATTAPDPLRKLVR